jgi:hypothetical protein
MITIGEWTLILLFTIPFIAGLVTGIKLMKMRMIVFLLKKLEPTEFEKLIENGEQRKNENERCGSSDIREVSSISGRASH